MNRFFSFLYRKFLRVLGIAGAFFSYNLRSLLVRRAATLLTVLGIAATVATVAGVLALQQGFASLYAESGREDLAVILRPGALSEGLSAFRHEGALKIVKSRSEFELDANEQPLAGLEAFLAVRRFRVDGGETNVPLRGVQPVTFAIRGDELRIVEGRNFTPGTDEVIVGRRIAGRIQNCQVDDVLELNVTPFRVVGVFECDGPFESEIWGDYDRMIAALERFGPNRILAQLKPGVDIAEFNETLRADPDSPAQAQTERDYMSSQTEALSFVLIFLSAFLGLIMGIAAVFTATNTMLSAIAGRTHEIGILLATGFRPFPIFVSFLLEATLLGLLGGLVGALFVLPLSGIETGTTNFATFTEVAFAFRVTLPVLATAIIFSLVLGVMGGAWPAWRAARLRPTEAMRRQ
jgi:putative ABC transport system permease protein